MDDATIIKYALKKSIQDLDLLLQSQVGHIINFFIMQNVSGSKFPESELLPENFQRYIEKLI